MSDHVSELLRTPDTFAFVFSLAIANGWVAEQAP